MTSTRQKTAYILTAGRLRLPNGRAGLGFLPAPDLVIAADAGAKHAAALGLRVDTWVGDFDSAVGDETCAPRSIYPTAKDSTDGELAIQLALEAGCTHLVIVGAFGGRFDHAAALLLGAVRLAEQGLELWLTSGDEHARPITGGQTLCLNLPAQTTLSVVSVSDLNGLSLSGVRWPLDRAAVPLGSGWTLSNVVTDAAMTAQLEQGRALVVWQDAEG